MADCVIPFPGAPLPIRQAANLEDPNLERVLADLREGRLTLDCGPIRIVPLSATEEARLASALDVVLPGPVSDR